MAYWIEVTDPAGVSRYSYTAANLTEAQIRVTVEARRWAPGHTVTATPSGSDQPELSEPCTGVATGLS